MEGERLALDPVLRPAGGGDPGEAGLGRAVEQVGAVGFPAAEARVDEVDELLAEPAPRSLVGALGVGVAVAENDRPLGERWLDRLRKVLPPVGEEEEELGARVEVARVEDEPAKPGPGRRPARRTARRSLLL